MEMAALSKVENSDWVRVICGFFIWFISEFWLSERGKPIRNNKDSGSDSFRLASSTSLY
jgi:hypothetical protein